MPSDISSTDIAGVAPGYGSTSRKDVLGRVDVPVVPGTASGARPLTCPERQRGEQVPASAARFAGGVPAVDDDHYPAGALCLVLNHGAEFAPAALADGLGESTIANHATHIEVFDGDSVEPAHQLRGGLVQEVAARVPDPGVRAGHPTSLLALVLRAALAAGRARRRQRRT